MKLVLYNEMHSIDRARAQLLGVHTPSLGTLSLSLSLSGSVADRFMARSRYNNGMASEIFEASIDGASAGTSFSLFASFFRDFQSKNESFNRKMGVFPVIFNRKWRVCPVFLLHLNEGMRNNGAGTKGGAQASASYT